MKNSKSTRKALFASALSLVLSTSMLIGTTWAWFTDSAVSSGNKIQSGTLNIDLAVKQADGEYASVKASSDPIFNYDKWEPGYTYWTNVKVETTGNLALKYTLKFVGEGVADAELAKVIDVYYAPSEVNKPDSRDLTDLTKLGTLADVMAGGAAYDVNDTLIPGSNTEDFATIALKMQESAGNEYQNKSIPAFDLAVVATQYTYEEDTFDNQYDANASMPIADQTSFNNAINNATPGSIVPVSAGIYEIANTTVLNEGVTLAGDGADKSVLKIKSDNGDGIKISNENVSIKNFKIDGTEITSGGYKSLVNVKKDGTVIDGCDFVGGGNNTWNSSIYVSDMPVGTTFTVKNSNITGSFRGVLRESCGANIVIDNCDIDAVYPINIDGGSTPSHVEVSNSKLHGWTSYSSVDYVKFTNTEFSKGNSGYDNIAAYVDTTLENCTFDSNFKLFSQTGGFKWTINNCTKNGVKVTADNFKTLFPEDSDDWNKATVFVDGVQVPAD